MGKVLYSDNIGFDMSDWEEEDICKIFAGTDCIMALTADGRVLQKTTSADIAARTRFWNNITDIALSGWLGGMAIGLVNDGTCMIAKRPARKLCAISQQSYDFDRINNAVKSWKDIVEVAASDAFFALDKHGRVHYVTTTKFDSYRETKNWENIVHIVTGNQGSVFGIDTDGRVFAAGHNCTAGPMGDMNRNLAEIRDAVDVCVSGSECETVYVVRRDGTVESIRGGNRLDFQCSPEPGSAKSHFRAMAFRETAGALRFLSDRGDEAPFGDTPVSSFALGDLEYGPAFVIAVVQDK